MPVTFLHTADWQLGKPFARVADHDQRSRLRAARLTAVRNLAPLVASTGAKFVLVAGDLFDSSTADRPTVAQACEAIATIPVPVIAIPGNHDHGGPGCLWDQPFFQRHVEAHAPNFTILRTPTPYACEEVLILPAPLTRQHTAEDPTAWLRTPSEEWRDDARPRVALAHGSVMGFSSSTTEDGDVSAQPNVLTLERLPMDALDYVALGDWHGVKQVALKAWYAGALEQDRHAKGDDYRAGCALVVTVSRGAPPVVREEPVGTVTWRQLAYSLLGEDALGRFREQLDRDLGAHGGMAVVDLVLTGSLAPEALERLRHELESLQARLLHSTVDNRVSLSLSPEEIRRMVNPAVNPTVAMVADRLLQKIDTGAPDSRVARLALQELVMHLRLAGVTA